jgi:RNA polymerase sigma-70 factor (ECF subfamily)
MAWLARIADREIADRADFHGRQRRAAAAEVQFDDQPEIAARVRSALSQILVDERAGQLEAAIAGLSDAHREIILLRKFEDLTFPEIAERLGKSEDACRMLFARAMTALTLRLSASDHA